MEKPVQNLSESLFHILKKDIIEGKYKEGTKLPSERELTEKYSVSRITVRDAISRLTQIRLLKTIPKSGTYVTDYLNEASVELLVEIMNSGDSIETEVLISLLEFRRLIELYAMEKAIALYKAEDLKNIKSIIAEMNRSRDEIEKLIQLDHRLHGAIVHLSGNIVVRLLFNSFKPVYSYYLEFFYNVPDIIDIIISHYNRLYDAMERKDVGYSLHILEEALMFGENMVKKSLENRTEVRLV